MDQAEKLSGHADVLAFLDFALQAFTHLTSTRYSESLLLSWVILEKHLLQLRDGLLKDQSVRGERKKRLQSSMFWSACHVLEVLNLMGIVDAKKYDLLSRMRVARNQLAHEGKKCSKQVAMDCFAEALPVVREMVENALGSICDASGASHIRKGK